MTSIIATRTYLEEDQREFAAWSGDFNPMHVDPVAARRTGAGAPVVHGVHNLLWCLDAIGRTLPHAGPIHSLRANFDSFVTIGEPIDAILVSHDAAKARAEIRVRGTLAVTIVLGFGDKRAALPEPAPETLYAPEAAVDLPPGEVATLAGRMPYASDNGTQRFPHAARMLGARRLYSPRGHALPRPPFYLQQARARRC
jgi:acyl dehydratase